jgi:hypothetical protein
VAPHLIANSPGNAEPVSLRDLASALAIVPGIGAIDLKDSPTAPPLLLVDMPEDVAERLRQAFEGRLTIESDAPLHPSIDRIGRPRPTAPDLRLVPPSTGQSEAPAHPRNGPSKPTL